VTTRVVAAVLYDEAGRVLLAQRPADKHMGGYWEFPGGKIAAGEGAAQALQRELLEELGVQVETAHCRPLLQLRHAYPDRVIDLQVFVLERWGGAPVGLEGQALQWLPPGALLRHGLLPADRPIVAALLEREPGSAVTARVAGA